MKYYIISVLHHFLITLNHVIREFGDKEELLINDISSYLCRLIFGHIGLLDDSFYCNDMQ